MESSQSATPCLSTTPSSFTAALLPQATLNTTSPSPTCSLLIPMPSSLVAHPSLGRSSTAFSDHGSSSGTPSFAPMPALTMILIPLEALSLLSRMLLRSNPRPNAYTLSFSLDACAKAGAATTTGCLHGMCLKLGFASNVFVLNATIRALADCCELKYARKVFDEIPQRDIVSWNIMLGGYVGSLQFEEAFALFWAMEEEIKGNEITAVTLLSACALSGNLEMGRKVHGYIESNHLRSNVIVSNALIDMYAKSGSTEEACKVFEDTPLKNVITWNTLISCYARDGSVDAARHLFDKMPERNVISWTSMMTGYVQNERSADALLLFQALTRQGIELDEVLMIGALSAVADLGCLGGGRSIHARLRKKSIRIASMLGASLIDMYAKKSRLDVALKVFNRLKEKDVNTWTAVITALAMHGCGRESLSMFASMERSQAKPNAVTFVAVLCACSHAGLVDDGFTYFQRMQDDYAIQPQIEHFGCMVDLLGRAGCLEDALDFIHKMPIKPNAGIWGALLGACRIHGNYDLAEKVSKKLIEVEPEHAGRYVFLSNMYATTDKWEEVDQVRKTMKDMKMEKSPGWSWIEADGAVNQFFAGDRTHSKHAEIILMLEDINKTLKSARYVPLADTISFDYEDYCA